MTDPANPLSDLPGYALRRAANAMMAELAQRLAALDLRVADATVLMLLDARADHTASSIGRMLDIKRANMVPLLNRSEDAGLIARRPLDGKSQAIVLTRKGEKRMSQARALIAEFEAELLARVPAAHRDHLLPALKALAR